MFQLIFAFDPATLFVLLLVVLGLPFVLIGGAVFAWHARNASQRGDFDPGHWGRRRPIQGAVANDDQSVTFAPTLGEPGT